MLMKNALLLICLLVGTQLGRQVVPRASGRNLRLERGGGGRSGGEAHRSGGAGEGDFITSRAMVGERGAGLLGAVDYTAGPYICLVVCR